MILVDSDQLSLLIKNLFISSDFCCFSQGKRSILRKAGSERADHGMRVKFNPLALLLDSSLEGEYDLVQRVIYDVSHTTTPTAWCYSVDPRGAGVTAQGNLQIHSNFHNKLVGSP